MFMAMEFLLIEIIVCKNIYEHHRKPWFGVSWAPTSPWLSDAWIIHTTIGSTDPIKFEQNVLGEPIFFIGWEKVKGFMHIWLKTSRLFEVDPRVKMEKNWWESPVAVTDKVKRNIYTEPLFLSYIMEKVDICNSWHYTA